MSFCRETSDGVAKCWLFSQAKCKYIYNLQLSFFFSRQSHWCKNWQYFTVSPVTHLPVVASQYRPYLSLVPMTVYAWRNETHKRIRNAWEKAHVACSRHSDGGDQVNLYTASAKKKHKGKNEGRWVGVRELPIIFCLHPTNFSPTPHHLNPWNRLGVI